MLPKVVWGLTLNSACAAIYRLQTCLNTSMTVNESYDSVNTGITFSTGAYLGAGGAALKMKSFLVLNEKIVAENGVCQV